MTMAGVARHRQDGRLLQLLSGWKGNRNGAGVGSQHELYGLDRSDEMLRHINNRGQYKSAVQLR
jgi:hypothetical protein